MIKQIGLILLITRTITDRIGLHSVLRWPATVTAKPKTSRQKQNISRQNRKPQGKNKNLTAKPNTSQQKPNTSRQNQKRHGKTKDLTAKPNTSQQKPNTSRRKQNTHGKTKAILLLL